MVCGQREEVEELQLSAVHLRQKYKEEKKRRKEVSEALRTAKGDPEVKVYLPFIPIHINMSSLTLFIKLEPTLPFSLVGFLDSSADETNLYSQKVVLCDNNFTPRDVSWILSLYSSLSF